MRLLLDAMCGDLRAYLRMCGHDTAYALDRGIEADDALLVIAETESRTLVTRDRELIERATARDIGTVRPTSTDTEAVLRTLQEAGVDLTLSGRPSRCGACNGRLKQVAGGGDGSATGGPGDRPAAAPPDRAVWRCRDCGQAFWKGGHWDRVAATLADL
ncbi:hypothetical protein BRD17_08505 [Halobacteriales archaeon SW_7_68_16]|nr:MAG: hypothetical protein BRD17_08505 [Halobacteriales archaeon SW_7_68_16]